MKRKFNDSEEDAVKTIARKYASLFDSLVDYERQLRKSDWGPLPEFSEDDT
jgi:hypothetical protein